MNEDTNNNDGIIIDEENQNISCRMMRPGSKQEEKYINYLIKKYRKIDVNHPTYDFD